MHEHDDERKPVAPVAHEVERTPVDLKDDPNFDDRLLTTTATTINPDNKDKTQ